MDQYLMHKGTPHEGMIPHSGRYEWGSGVHSFQRLDDGFTQMVRKLYNHLQFLHIPSDFKTAFTKPKHNSND